MYTRLSRSGGRTYLQIVEGFRDPDGKVRQRLVANLGRLDQLEPKHLDALISGLQRAVGRVVESAPVPEYESALAFGEVYALHQLWKQLGFDRVIRRALRSSRRSFDAEAVVRAMVFNRLCAPDSKLGCLDWLQTVAMPLMPEAVSHDQLLRTMDALMDHAEVVESLVAEQLHPLLDQQLSVVFYDLTTIRIHGESTVTNDLRAYGLNKETGAVARQFVLGVVQSAEGLPLLHTVHEGNVSEAKTLKAMLEKVLARFPIQRVIVVADRGLLNLDNVADLARVAEETQRRLQFILAVPARRYGALADIVKELTFNDGLAESHFADQRMVIAHDPESAKAQSAKRRARIEELQEFASKLTNKLDKQDAGKTDKGRRASDRGAYTRFSRAILDAELSRFVKADFESDLFSYHVDEAAIKNAEVLDGTLVLLTNVDDFSAAEILQRYKSLADIERGFRVLKSDLEIAPVFHRLPERIRAHALICFLALVMHRVLRMRLKASGGSTSPKTALEMLRPLQRHRVRIGTQQLSGIGRITPEQLELFKSIQIPPPN